MLIRKTERIGALLLTVFYGFWVLAFHLPNAFKSFGSIGAWNAPAEITFLTMGGLALFAAGAGHLRGHARSAWRACLQGPAPSCSASRISTTRNSPPPWCRRGSPTRLFWACATGAGHLAAGLAFVSGIQARLAAACHAGMMGSFVVLLHIPRVIAAPDQHAEWIMLAVSSALTGSAWLLRKYVF